VQHEYGGYTFRAIDDHSRLSGTSRVLNAPASGLPSGSRYVEEYAKYLTRFRGALLTLFGPPTNASGLADEAFMYVFEASDEAEHSWTLYANSGAFGPGIGGPVFDATCQAPAKALLELIESTSPADFDAKVYDDDTDNTVKYGIRDGEPYYEESPGKHLD
jgi:hypothetical protein